MAGFSHAIFFEPFEHGYAVLDRAFRAILERAEQGESLVPGARSLFENLIKDFEVRVALTPGSPLLEILDDKWLFTRSFFEEVSVEAGFKGVEIYCIYPTDTPLRTKTESLLRLGAGLEPTALSSWAWDILRQQDERFADRVNRDWPLEGAVILST